MNTLEQDCQQLKDAIDKARTELEHKECILKQMQEGASMTKKSSNGMEEEMYHLSHKLAENLHSKDIKYFFILYHELQARIYERIKSELESSASAITDHNQHIAMIENFINQHNLKL